MKCFLCGKTGESFWFLGPEPSGESARTLISVPNAIEYEIIDMFYQNILTARQRRIAAAITLLLERGNDVVQLTQLSMTAAIFKDYLSQEQEEIGEV